MEIKEALKIVIELAEFAAITKIADTTAIEKSRDNAIRVIRRMAISQFKIQI